MKKNDDLHPLLARNNRAKTSADVAYEIIGQSILNGDLPPGTKLSRRRMAQLTGMSIIPVIEALHSLEEEGLVESYPYFGSQVIQLNEETIRDRFSLREAVDCQVARVLAVHMTSEQENTFRFLASELDATPRTDIDTFWDRHYKFHMALARATGRPSLEKSLHRISLFQLLQRSVTEIAMTHKPVPSDLHMQIVEGIATRDPDTAERVMRDHIYFFGMRSE